MDKCRIAYNGHALVTAGFVSLVHAVERRYGCAHAYAGVHHAERSHRAERIAADVAADIDFESSLGHRTDLCADIRRKVRADARERLYLP